VGVRGSYQVFRGPEMKGTSYEREEHQAADVESRRSGRDAGRSVAEFDGMHHNLRRFVTRDNKLFLKSLRMTHNGASSALKFLVWMPEPHGSQH
jgi:hypothetical protein